MFGFIKKSVGDLTRGVRGVGRMFRGKFKEGLGDIGAAASVAAPFLPGGLAVRAGVGALGSLMGGGGVGEAVTRGGLGALGAGGIGSAAGRAKDAVGGRELGMSALGKLLGGGGGGGGGGSLHDIPEPGMIDPLTDGLLVDGQGAGAGAGGGQGGRLQQLLALLDGGVKSAGGGSRGQGLMRLGGLGLMGAQLADSRKQRASAADFNQQRLDTVMAALEKGEAQSDARQPMGGASMQYIMEQLAKPGFLQTQLR